MNKEVIMRCCARLQRKTGKTDFGCKLNFSNTRRAQKTYDNSFEPHWREDDEKGAEKLMLKYVDDKIWKN